MPDLAFLALAVLLAFTVEAAIGFGGTLVTVTLAAQRMPVDEVLATFMPVSLMLSAWLAIRGRRSIAWGLLRGQVLPWMGAGFVVGLGLFTLRGEGWIRGAFGAFVVVLSLAELARPSGAVGRAAPVARAAALLGAGVVHGLFACGGPLLVWVVGREGLDKTRFRATLAAVWVVLGVGLLGSYAVAGTLGPATLPGSAVLLGPLALGLTAGEWLHHRIDAARFRVGVFVGLVAAGAALVWRSVG